MRIPDIVHLSTRMFKTRLLRTALTILGVSVGIGTIVFLVSLGYGLQTILLERITTSESLLSLDVLPADSETAGLTSDTISALEQIPHVSEVVPISIVPAQLTVGESVTDTTANVAPAGLFRLSGIESMAGTLYDGENENHIVVSSVLAQLFGWKPEDAVGKQVRLTLFYGTSSTTPNGKLSVVGSSESQQHYQDVTIGAVIPGDTSFMYIPPTLFPDVPSSYIAQAKVRVENADVMESVRTQILEKGLSVSALFDVVDQANKIFKALQIVLGVFGAAALLVSAIGMFNTMTIAFLERTQEIGIMRAMGAARRDVFSLFVVESAFMGFLGGFGGILIGYIVQALVNFGLNLLARAFGGSPVVLFRTPLWLVFAIIAFSTSVGILTGIIPGRRASKLNPLEALKYK